MNKLIMTLEKLQIKVLGYFKIKKNFHFNINKCLISHDKIMNQLKKKFII